MPTCPNCNNPEAEVLLIDTHLPLGSKARRKTRYCYSCRPEARHYLSHLLPQWLYKMDLSRRILLAALEARCYAPDYPFPSDPRKGSSALAALRSEIACSLPESGWNVDTTSIYLKGWSDYLKR
jgi:hypothetical protein